MNMDVPEYVSVLMKRLNEHGKECWIVGGAVRSSLLNLPIHDYDLTTNALPYEMKTIFSDYHTIETGLKHGTLTVISSHKPVEITTYRKDSTYQDHRHPDSVQFSRTLEEDCSRRDFTINAMCYSPILGFRDYYHGFDDLRVRLIRCIRNPEERFEEDALRILRAIRFAAQLNFEIEEKTANALLKKRYLLEYVSAERIHEECNGILAAKASAKMIRTYKAVFEVFIPELKEYSQNELDQVLLAMERCVNAADIRMAVLLTPMDHPHRVLNRLKYSNRSMKAIQSLIRYHNADISTRISLRRLLKVLPAVFDDYLYYRCAIDPSIDAQKTRDMYFDLRHDAYCWNLKDLAVKGSDLIALGYTGKNIAAELDHLLNQVIEEKTPNDKDQLIAAALSHKNTAR